MNVLLGVFGSPQRINIHNCQSRVLLRRDLNLDGVSMIMNQIVIVENGSEVLPPPLFVKFAPTQTSIHLDRGHEVWVATARPCPDE